MKSIDSADVSNRKPRRFRGTPSYRIRNIFTAVLVVYTVICGASFMVTPVARGADNTFELLSAAKRQELEDTTPEERNRNNAMFLAYQSVSKRQQLNIEDKSKAQAES